MNLQREDLIEKVIKKNSNILDVGCVHNEDVMLTKNWQHNFLLSKSTSVTGIDFNMHAINKLKKKGFNVVYADAQNFNLNKNMILL